MQNWIICCSAFCVMLVLSIQVAVAQENIPTVYAPNGQSVIQYRESHALLIGVSNDTSGRKNIPNLPVELQMLDNVLSKKGFTTHQVLNPSGVELEEAIRNFVNQFGKQSNQLNNRLLIYFAGEAITQTRSNGEKVSYLLGSDAPSGTSNLIQGSVSVEKIMQYAREMIAKHVLFVFDTAMDGLLLADITTSSEIELTTGQAIRHFIIAGSSGEDITSSNIFRQQFQQALEGSADLNQDQYITGSELGLYLATQVTLYSGNRQHPIQGKITDAFLNQGEFVFPLQVSAPTFATTMKQPTSELSGVSSKIYEPYQQAMNEAFTTLVETDKKSTTPETILNKWKTFMVSYEEANPFSQVDDTMRVHASKRVIYWEMHDQAMQTLEMMKADFQSIQTQELEGKSATALLTAWQQFLADYPEDNSYTSEDEILTREAQDQVSYWQDRVTWENTLLTMQQAFDALQNEMTQSNNYETLVGKWEQFVMEYEADNPFSETDESLREMANMQINALKDRGRLVAKLSAMKQGFEESNNYEKTESDRTLLVMNWTTFKAKYSEDIPFSQEDEEMRQVADERLNYWQHGGDRLTSITSGKTDQNTSAMVATSFAIEGQPFKNSIDMEFVWLNSGTFVMGNFQGEKDEEPIRTVTIGDGFWLGKYEVTQRQWEAIMGSNPSITRGANMPVENVSWNEIQEFLKILNAREGTQKYRLPTEAEWEFAARAGTLSHYGMQNDAGNPQDYGWYSENSERQAHIIGKKRPNAWGLYDMHGNVWEWVQDWYGNYVAQDTLNPEGPRNGENKVLRGGSFREAQGVARITNRYPARPSLKDFSFGFRIVRMK